MKNIIGYLAIIIAIIIIGIGGVFIYKKNNIIKLPPIKIYTQSYDYEGDDVPVTAINYEVEDMPRDGLKKDIYSYNIKSNKIDNYKNSIEYFDLNANYIIDSTNHEKVGTITCFTNNCYVVGADNKNVIIAENGSYYIYDYVLDALIFGPYGNYDLSKNDYNSKNKIIRNTNNIIEVLLLYKDESMDIYNLKNNKLYQNINYTTTAYSEDTYFDNVDIYNKYGIIALSDMGNVALFDINNGKYLASWKDIINFETLDVEKDTYLILYNSLNEYYIYDHLGKPLFDGDIINDIVYENNEVTISRNSAFEVYDSDNKLLRKSKYYDRILKVMKGYIAALKNNSLILLDNQDNLIITFITNYDKNRYYFHNLLSGWYEENNKEGIYLVIQDKNTTAEEVYNYHLTLGDAENYSLENLQESILGYTYYYIPETEETGKIPTVINP